MAASRVIPGRRFRYAAERDGNLIPLDSTSHTLTCQCKGTPGTGQSIMPLGGTWSAIIKPCCLILNRVQE